MSRDTVATVTALRQGHALRLDRIAPCWHAAAIWHTLVEVPPTATFSSIRAAEIGPIPARAILELRSLPDHALKRVAGMTPTRSPCSIGAAMGDGEAWALLAENPDAEIVAGAIGAIWRPVIQWVGFEPADFASFGEPGYAKVATGFSVRHYGADRSLLSIEVRAVATSEEAREALSRYWLLCRPFIRLVMRGTARSIKTCAERRGPLAVQPM